MNRNNSIKGLLLGVFVGAIGFGVWDYIFSEKASLYETIQNQQIEELKLDTQGRLLYYIEGKWSSSIGDVQIELDIDKSKDFIVVELEKGQVKEKKQYKVVKVVKISGIFGIVNFDICELNDECRTGQIPIQINKLFGVNDTITISYDSRLTYCIDPKEQCTRAFKRIE